MNEQDRELILRHLLENASEDDAEKINEKLKESAEFRELLLDHLDIEAFLHSEAKAGSFAEDQEAFFHRLEAPAEKTAKVVPFTRRTWFRTVVTTSAAAACVMLGFVFLNPSPLNAASALQRVIDAAMAAGDRTYVVSVTRGAPQPPGPRGHEVTQEQAQVYLRGTNQWLVTQDLTNGSGQRITGFDGEQSWTVSGSNTVYVADNAEQFRRNLPGANVDVPFLNLHEQLEDLRENYDITLSDDQDSGLPLLRALKKSRDINGPRELLIWFDPESGIIRRLDVRRPVSGTPRILRMDLVEQSPLPADFFSHPAHHEPERPVSHDPPRRNRR
ncbi:MAG: hypothetical protein AAF591_16300 [Verrucomicrobiota bacterium]